jgi:Zn-dependent peptidase ImmA (M78 family)
MASIAQRRRALQAADELLNDLGVDQESPINIFDVVGQLGLRLVFNPLNSLLGAVLPKGDGGIMLTTQRRPAVQRYTAAHEIGHWILDIDEPAFDTEDDIYYPSVDRERLAQLFAGQLLMPPPLVFATCARYGISDAAGATGGAVYLVARDMGTSYEAAAHQMANLDLIGRTELRYLLSLTPAKIKTGLCRGHRPAGSVDVWPVDFSFAGSQVHVTEGDELFVALPENRTTGYRWLTDDEVRARGEREVAPPPAPFADGRKRPHPARQSEDIVVRSRSGADIKRALARIPGNADPRRILPVQLTAGDEAGTETMEPTDRDSRWDISAATVKPAYLQVIEDRFQAGWAAVPLSAMRSVRQTIAGRQDLVLPEEVHAYRSQQAPGESSDTGLRANALPVAATGYRLIALRSVGEGMHTFHLSYTSAVDPRAPAVESYHLDVVVSLTPQVQRRRQLLQVDLDDDALDPEELP